MEVNPRYENRIIGENPNGNDGRNERVNKLKKILLDCLNNRMDHVENRIGGGKQSRGIGSLSKVQ